MLKYTGAKLGYIHDYDTLLPTEIIQSRPVDEGESEKILNEALSLSEDSNHGMLLEVDIEYPKNLHKDHNPYPLCPQKLKEA
jgi:hypothetical protein